MHKARQNPSGSFSIGKTWVLDDLTAIESYKNPNPSTAEEQQNKERAGGFGFLITIQKPYYWQAFTTTEKETFIYSLIRIYKKYTGGKLPQLHGFDPHQLEQRVGPGPYSEASLTKPPPQSQAQSQAISHIHTNRPTHIQQSERSLQNGREIRPRAPEEHSSRERLPQARGHPPSLQVARPSQERVFQVSDSSAGTPNIPGSFPPSEFVRNLYPENAQSELRKRESQSSIRHARHADDPADLMGQQEPNLRRIAGAQSVESFRNRLEQQSSRTFTSGGTNGDRTKLDRENPPTGSLDSSNQQPVERFDSNTIPTPLRTGTPDYWPPSKAQGKERRPSRTGSKPSSSYETSRSEFSEQRLTLAPLQALPTDLSHSTLDLTTLNDHRLDISHGEPTQPLEIALGATSTTPNEENHINDQENINEGESKPTVDDDRKKSAEEPSSIASLEPPAEGASEGESHRPGLGPMIKKKSNKEIANTMLKAANTYNAFKPRPGGAAEKILNSEKRATDEHDGVSGVFPAPSIMKRASLEAVEISTSEASREPQTISPPQPSEVTPLQTTIVPVEPLEIIPPTPPTQGLSPGEQTPAAPEFPREDRRTRRRSDNSTKYAKSLGINHSLLEGRTSEFDSILSELGWNEEATNRYTFEGLQSGLRKEITRLEAGSWLGVLENGDEKVAAVGHIMDKVIAECEELDCLLTLYNAELGVS